jgi:adenosylmethionine-8-amino-7-oxononanoate aminotransferase
MDEIKVLEQLARDHVWINAGQWNGLILVEGKGCRVKDINGKTYIDSRSGYTGVNAGFSREEIADAISAQLHKFNFASAGFTTIPAIRLSAKLASLAPGTLSRVFLVTGGSEANETAIKIAKSYHRRTGHPKRYKVISRWGSYHGHMAGTMGLGSSTLPVRDFEPLAPGSLHVSPVYCYRCDFGLKYPDCDLQCVKEIKRLIEYEGPESVAAFLSEPISAASGGTVPPPEYWPMVRSICDEYGILLIADEVINGFGRTGKMFACEHWDYVPDILCLAKGITSLHLPVGATVVKSEIAEKFIGEGVEPFPHVVTFGAIPACCAAALANIEIIEREKLVENAANMGEYLHDKLESLRKHPIVGDIRGIGLMQFVEVVRDKRTKERFRKEDNFTARYVAKCLEKGLISAIYADIAISVTPPLVVTKSDIDEVVSIIDEVIGELEKELSIVA